MKKITLLILCIIFIPKQSYTQDDAYLLYEEGIHEIQKSNFSNAVNLLSGALQIDNLDNDKKRLYGMQFVEYFPNRELGISYYELSNFDSAKFYLQLSLVQEETERASGYLELVNKKLTPLLKILAVTFSDVNKNNLLESEEKGIFDLEITNEGFVPLTEAELIISGTDISSFLFVNEKTSVGTIYSGEKKRMIIPFTAKAFSKESIFNIEFCVLGNRQNVKDCMELGITADPQKELNPVTISDLTGPVVAINEPLARGIKVVSKKDIITVKGEAYDESGVSSVSINDRKASLDEAGLFNLNMNLQLGDNTLIVRAVDTKNNVSVDTFIIERKAEEIITTGKYYAFIIGIDNYEGHWSPLRNAVNDAKAVSELLMKSYRFDNIYSLYNEDATRAKIISTMEELADKITGDDNLLIYYSGHGDFIEKFNRGYWVPVDAKTKSTVDFIPNSQIQEYINGIKSKHTLLITDACFTGDIFRGESSELPFEKTDRYIIDAYNKPSRFAMTSGGLEPVADGGMDDHSIFTYYLLKYLTEMDVNYFSARELFNQLEKPVINNSEQKPLYKPLKFAGDEGGQFIFLRKQ